MENSLRQVIAANNLRQAHAKGLNFRAGQAVFSVYSRVEILEFVLEKLGGATRIAEVSDPNVLLLPSLDQDQVAKVERENPLQISVFGREVSVDYGTSVGGPVVRVDFFLMHAKDWLAIPTEGIRLPGGREVFLRSLIEGHRYYITAPSSEFIKTAIAVLNKGEWDMFFTSADKEKPNIVLPNIESSEVPGVIEHSYAVCAVRGSPLIAFGTVSVREYCYSVENTFTVKWCQTRDEAEVFYRAAALKLADMKTSAADAARRVAEQSAAKKKKEAEEKLAQVKTEQLLASVKKGTAQSPSAFGTSLGSLSDVFGKLKFD